MLNRSRSNRCHTSVEATAPWLPTAATAPSDSFARRLLGGWRWWTTVCPLATLLCPRSPKGIALDIPGYQSLPASRYHVECLKKGMIHSVCGWTNPFFTMVTCYLRIYNIQVEWAVLCRTYQPSQIAQAWNRVLGLSRSQRPPASSSPLRSPKSTLRKRWSLLLIILYCAG